MFSGRICLPVCLYNALPFERLDLKSSFSVSIFNGTSSQSSDQIRIPRSSGQGQGHRSKSRVCVSQAFAIWSRWIPAVAELCTQCSVVLHNISVEWWKWRPPLVIRRNLRRVRLVLGWVPCPGSIPGAGNLSRYVTSHLGQMSLAIPSWV